MKAENAEIWQVLFLLSISFVGWILPRLLKGIDELFVYNAIDSVPEPVHPTILLISEAAVVFGLIGALSMGVHATFFQAIVVGFLFCLVLLWRAWNQRKE